MTYLVTLNNGIVFLGHRGVFNKLIASFSRVAKFTVIGSKTFQKGSKIKLPLSMIKSILKDGQKIEREY